MKRHPYKTIIIALIVVGVVCAILFHPATVRSAFDLKNTIPMAGKVLNDASTITTGAKPEKKPDAQSVQVKEPAQVVTTRPALIAAKQKCIAEIREEIAALVEELEALLQDN